MSTKKSGGGLGSVLSVVIIAVLAVWFWTDYQSFEAFVLRMGEKFADLVETFAPAAAERVGDLFEAIATRIGSGGGGP